MMMIHEIENIPEIYVFPPLSPAVRQQIPPGYVTKGPEN